jgi:hypothetical protein
MVELVTAFVQKYTLLYFLTQLSNTFYSQKELTIQFIFNMQYGIYRLVLLSRKGT